MASRCIPNELVEVYLGMSTSPSPTDSVSYIHYYLKVLTVIGKNSFKHDLSKHIVMKGVVLLGNRRLEVREFPTPKLGYGQVLVRMKASGLCGSDLHALYRPLRQTSSQQVVIAGHEPCGQIEEIGPGVKRFKPGDRVKG